MPGSVAANLAIAISAPVLPADTAAAASPSFTASIATPHGRTSAAAAKRLARLLVHADRDGGVHQPAGLPELRMRAEQRLDLGLVAEQDEACTRMLRQRHGGARDDH